LSLIIDNMDTSLQVSFFFCSLHDIVSLVENVEEKCFISVILSLMRVCWHSLLYKLSSQPTVIVSKRVETWARIWLSVGLQAVLLSTWTSWGFWTDPLDGFNKYAQILIPRHRLYHVIFFVVDIVDIFDIFYLFLGLL
jgi:hypothetical protein